MFVCIAEWADSCRILSVQASMGRNLIVAVYKQFKFAAETKVGEADTRGTFSQAARQRAQSADPI